MPCACNGDSIANTRIVAALNPVTCMWLPPDESELNRQTDGRRDGEPAPQTAAVLAGPRDREERRLDVVLVLAVEHVEHFSREREDTPSEEEDFAEAQIEPVVRRQADLIPLGPERECGAVLSQEPAAGHAAAVAPLRAKRERRRKTKRPDRVERVPLVVIARKGETIDLVDHARVPVGVCHPSAETAGAAAANRRLDAA